MQVIILLKPGKNMVREGIFRPYLMIASLRQNITAANIIIARLTYRVTGYNNELRILLNVPVNTRGSLDLY
jgi:hypothetical protein